MNCKNSKNSQNCKNCKNNKSVNSSNSSDSINKAAAIMVLLLAQQRLSTESPFLYASQHCCPVLNHVLCQKHGRVFNKTLWYLPSLQLKSCCFTPTKGYKESPFPLRISALLSSAQPRALSKAWKGCQRNPLVSHFCSSSHAAVHQKRATRKAPFLSASQHC